MTIAIILSTHGFTSETLLQTTEMIVGTQKNIAWVNLLPEENTDTLIKKYSTHLSNLNTETGVLFLVDIWGGSPFNAAKHIILNKETYDIITGVNVPMLIELCMAREEICSFTELVQIALKYGRDSIKSVKYSLKKENDHDNNSNILYSNKQKKLTTKTTNINSQSSLKKNIDKNHMIICLARIDDRLIHGQVVTRWAKEYKIQRIIVINDEIYKDTIRSTLIKQATPPGITAHVIKIDKAVRVYNNPKYAGEKVIMLFTNPSDVLQLVKQGIPITSINIGGMAFYQGKKQIDNVISVNNIDIAAFKKLHQHGIELEIRKVPSDSSIQLINLIKNIHK